MKPVYQTRNGWPHGNCLMASVASVLELDLATCPDLAVAEAAGRDHWDVMREFVQQHGHDAAWLDGPPPKGYAVVSLMQPSGTAHACVALDGRIVHNPLAGAPLDFPATVRGYIAFVPLASPCPMFGRDESATAMAGTR